MDRILSDIEREYLLPRSSVANPQLSASQRLLPKDYVLDDFLSLSRSWLGSTMSMLRDPVSGEYCGAVQASLPVDVDPMSFSRAAGRPESYAVGSSTQVPFQPGGVDMQPANSSNAADSVLAESGASELCTVPDGFDRGLFVVAEAGVPKVSEDIDLAAGRYGSADADIAQDDTAASAVEESQAGDSGVDEVDQLVSIPESSKPAHTTAANALEMRKEWAHVVDVAAGFSNFHSLVPKLARDFPFELDVFQKRAVYHLERGDSVFVAAHTSAGKTVVAEYAVALSQLHMTKTIYTSPIKALSNQKFRDFTQTFGDDNVGILTGDVKIRPEAPCLIMTTEVLKNMLYRGADVLRDVEFVVFDECHYVNDLERGVVWEEVIIMLPRHVSIILLSATVPNTKEFAEWVGRTKKRDIYVINTSKRPVPLEHYLYVGKNSVVNKEAMRIVDKSGGFNSNEWKDAYSAVNKAPQTKSGSSVGRQGGKQGGGGGGGSSSSKAQPRQASGHLAMKAVGRHTAERQGATLWVHLIGHLRAQGLLPAVVFTFSRKKCEEYAFSLRNLDFLNESKRSEVHMFVDRCLKRLKAEDRLLPQIQTMRDLLKRGIGVHHSGLLPIVKEMIELLFARGLIYCLFATETFAMGVNMPARCVVFSSLRKHDGRSFRELLPGEYTQMAGRAGRRGLDDTGVVLINAVNEVPDTITLHKMILGPATKLESQFRLTYTMILNLLRAKQLRVEEVIKRSFGENTAQGQAPEHERRLAQVKQQLDGFDELGCPICEDDLSGYYRIARSAHRLSIRLHTTAARRTSVAGASKYIAQSFCAGRLAIISHFPKISLGVITKVATTDGSFIACMILNCPVDGSDGVLHSDSVLHSVPPYPIADPVAALSSLNQADIRYKHMTVPTSSVVLLLDAVVKLSPLPALPKQQHSSVDSPELPPALATKIRASLSALCGQSPAIEYPWHRIRELEFQELVLERSRLIGSAAGFQCCSCPDLAEHFLATHKRAELQGELDELTMQLSDQNLDLLPDYRLRLDILKDLGYVDEMGNVQLKGRVACEMNSADELVLTELILDNTLAMYEPEEIVALLSAFVCTEKNEPADLMDRVPPRLKEGRERVVEAARRVGSIQAAYGLPISVEEYVREFRFGLLEVTYEWARGLAFQNITTLSESQEGIIVRCILRIDDVLKNAMSASFLVGDMDLKLKLQAASELIRRDIVFAASLYF
ncbi:Antiviral helicase ski2 [Dipsacomyces acuminosporus]|nr:Antiviral helicase ski2 [Dipsacomyces acuminosporus]